MLYQKNITAFINLVFITALVTACGSGTKQENKSSETAAKEGASSCLADYVEGNKIEKMISAEEVAAIVNKPVEDLEYSESKSSSAKYSSFGYEWESDDGRTMTMEMESGGRKISQTIPLKDQIDIGRVEVFDPKGKSPLEYFDFVYGPKTKKQKEAAKQAIDNAAGENNDVDEKAAETLKSMVDKSKSGSRLDDVGDRAYWGEGDASGMVYVKLKVLDGDTMFEITTDVSEDTQEDLRVAKDVAKQIIAKCK